MKYYDPERPYVVYISKCISPQVYLVHLDNRGHIDDYPGPEGVSGISIYSYAGASTKAGERSSWTCTEKLDSYWDVYMYATFREALANHFTDFV